jgi:hypothetical protein
LLFKLTFANCVNLYQVYFNIVFNLFKPRQGKSTSGAKEIALPDVTGRAMETLRRRSEN